MLDFCTLNLKSGCTSIGFGYPAPVEGIWARIEGIVSGIWRNMIAVLENVVTDPLASSLNP